MKYKYWDYLFKIGTKQEPIEFMSFINYILGFGKPKVILEIGTASGGSLFAFHLIASDEAKIISIDLFGGKFGYGYPSYKKCWYKTFCKEHQKQYLLRCDSHETSTFNSVLKILGNDRIDLLFIDGDHSYSGVQCDFNMYSPLVKTGGFIVLHDVQMKFDDYGTKQFWLDIKDQYQHQLFASSYYSPGIGLITK